MNEWDEYSVIELANTKREQFIDGDWIEAPYITSSGTRLLQTGNVGIGKLINTGTKRYISDQSFRMLKCKEVFIGDILICRLADPAGRACLVRDIGEKRMITSVDVTIYRPDSQKVDRRFLVSMMSTDAWFREVNERCGGSTRTRIARSELGRIRLRIPGLEEQKRIADALSSADALIATLERLIIKKQAIKQGMMQELLTGKTRLPGFKRPWSKVELGDLAEVVSGGTPSSSVQAYWDGGIPWATPTDITRERGRYLNRTERTISKAGLEHSAARLLPAGSLLLCTRATVGEVKIAAVPTTTNQGFKSLVPNSGVSSAFLYYKVLTLKDALTSRGSGSTFLEVSQQDVTKLVLDVPDTSEQVAIATALTDADDEIDCLAVRLRKARDIKQGMMQELLTGRTRLPLQEAVV